MVVSAAHAILPTPERVAAFVVDGAFLVIQRASLLAYSLPEIGANLTDWHLSVEVGENRVGFTVGPHFLSYNEKGDIYRQIIQPPIGFQPPISDLNLEWSSHHGLTHLFIPQLHVHGGVLSVGKEENITFTRINPTLDDLSPEELPASERPTLAPTGNEPADSAGHGVAFGHPGGDCGTYEYERADESVLDGTFPS